MLLKEEQACIKVRVVVLVGHAPANRPKLPALLDDTVEEGLDIHQRSPFLEVNLVDQLLGHHGRVCPVKARLQARRRFKRHLDCDLEEPDRECWRDLAGDPKAEVGVDLLRLQQHIFQLAHVADAQVGVLQDHPAARQEGVVVFLAGDLLLALAHGHLVGGEALLLLRELVDRHGRVAAGGQEIQHRLPRTGLVVDVGDDVGHRCSEPAVEHRFYKLRA
mmetsp:Transcript_115844/g.374314  ORF Transcript_115844/g.374314 Transcript_115844/m.374314 type:complete len:219 (-) Transcript_115844:153-809(-)